MMAGISRSNASNTSRTTCIVPYWRRSPTKPHVEQATAFDE